MLREARHRLRGLDLVVNAVNAGRRRRACFGALSAADRCGGLFARHVGAAVRGWDQPLRVAGVHEREDCRMPDRTMRIYVSSPGDVADERIALVEVVRRLEYDPFVGDIANLRVVSWDNEVAPVPMLASEPPQSSVNTMLARPSECDVFVAVLWSRMGSPLPERIFPRREQGQFRSGTEWEIEDALGAGRPSGPDVVIYRKFPPATVPLGDPAWQEKAEQYATLESYLASLGDRLRCRGFGDVQRFDTLDQFRLMVDAHLRHLLARRIRSWSRRDRGKRPPVVRNRSRCPYPGLAAFTPANSDVFFGRDAEVDELVDVVRSSPLTAMVGDSGCGKSSVLGAGLIPRLAAPYAGPPRWVTPSFDEGVNAWKGPRITPAGGHGDPLSSLALALGSWGHGVPESGSAGARCRRCCEEILATSRGARRALIVVDQFEEAFAGVDPAAREEFVDTVVSLAERELATVVLSVRADFLGRALELERLAPYLRSATFPLAPPGLGAIRDMIGEPARVAGLRFDPDLPELLLVHTRQEPGRLPLLAFALNELYRIREGDRLTLAAYESIGGVEGAVGRLAERCVQNLPEPVRAGLGSIFRKLVEVDDVGGPVRRKVRLAGLRDHPARRALVDALVKARLLVVGSEKGQQPFVELAHEALFRGWPRLTEWIDGAHDDLLALGRMRRASAEWRHADRDPLFLWLEERMDPVRAAAARLDAELAEHERAFLRPEVDRLFDELRLPTTGHRRRRDISVRLAALGDPRRGVGVDARGNPDIVWCRVPRHPADPGRPFWIAKYPVTVAQLDAYRRSLIRTDSQLRSGLERSQGTLPAAVSWSEAVGFGKWLDAAACQGQLELPNQDVEGYAVRLPFEAEWIAAAGFAPYPWGIEFDESRANTASSGLGEPIAVGMYPLGDAATGVSDMAGGVWEWCGDDVKGSQRDEYGHLALLRVLKGGSALEGADLCRVDRRRVMRGDVVREDRSFRVCFGPTDENGDTA